MSLTGRAVAYGRMIRFPHSVFALPFALTATLLAAREGGITGGQVFWIVVAMVAARSAAMGFNRLVDHAIDARNPRTATRELPRGVVSRPEVLGFVILSSAAFVLAAGMLNSLCLALSPVALAIVLGYSYTKRFTVLSHLVLGLSLAIAPIGAWIAVRGTLDGPALLMGGGVMFWVAGFDIIYSCQDYEVDRGEGLFSIPARFGIKGALVISAVLHLFTMAFFCAGNNLYLSSALISLLFASRERVAASMAVVELILASTSPLDTGIPSAM